ncbi:TetR/AcrR family transcriptional regulator [Nocardiopsis dassonvillei]|uniref:TetR/AcrR family transcriptional regulator n=1 Tax=Nocardiopsis dassonvillei TaxID=2014 RepID=UPI00200E3121|nr:TetR/AcrR family transcriptional regulator [Nocardiopsis dassonvillei]MCK9870845.1 TetR/AcrR family transcriptional regulator [Nocardiopsis dassonvillei]
MNPDDPRVQRTRERLRTALLTLTAESPSGAVTVSTVARRAGVNRATVYQHYADLDALVADAMESAVAHVARCAALCPLDAPRDRAPRPLVELFGHVADSAVLYRRMLSDHGSARFTNRLRGRLAEELATRFARGARPPGFDDVPVRTHAAYLAGALVGVIADWVGVGEAAETNRTEGAWRSSGTGGTREANGAEGAAAPEEAALAFWRLVRG